MEKMYERFDMEAKILKLMDLNLLGDGYIVNRKGEIVGSITILTDEEFKDREDIFLATENIYADYSKKGKESYFKFEYKAPNEEIYNIKVKIGKESKIIVNKDNYNLIEFSIKENNLRYSYITLDPKYTIEELISIGNQKDSLFNKTYQHFDYIIAWCNSNQNLNQSRTRRQQNFFYTSKPYSFELTTNKRLTYKEQIWKNDTKLSEIIKKSNEEIENVIKDSTSAINVLDKIKKTLSEVTPFIDDIIDKMCDEYDLDEEIKIIVRPNVKELIKK